MKDIWQESGMTIVIPPSGAQGERLFQVAQYWAELKLLSPSVWVRDLEASKSSQRPPKQKAQVLGNLRSGAKRILDVDLFEQLSRQSLFNVRLVVVRNATEVTGHDAEQDALVEMISKYVEFSLPMAESGKEDSSAKTNLVKLNLLTTTTEHVSDHARKLVGPQYNANFVASTEDRSTPLAGDAFVHCSEDDLRFAGYTMMHLATIGALWAGLPQGLYELVKPEVWSGDKAYVSRVFMSAILTDGLARRAASRVLQRAANPIDGFADLTSEVPIDGTYPIADSNADEFLNYMANLTFTFDDEILSYNPSIAKKMPAKFSFTFFRQIGDFLSFSGDKLGKIPYYAVIWVWRKIIRLVNRVFQGGDKGSAMIQEPQEKLDRRDIILQEQRLKVFETKKKADETLESPITPSQVRSTPELWSSIRKLVFGMLDGSNLQNFGFTKSDNGWPIFYKVSSVFHDPAKKLSIPDPNDPDKTLELSWSNLTEASEASGAIFQSNADLKNSIQETLQELVALRREADEAIVALEADRELLSKRPSAAELQEESA
jgi:hypothetical protein